MAPLSEESVNPRDIDKVISEVAGMAGRWNLFKRFLVDRLQVSRLLAPASGSEWLFKHGSRMTVMTKVKALRRPMTSPDPHQQKLGNRTIPYILCLRR